MAKFKPRQHDGGDDLFVNGIVQDFVELRSLGRSSIRSSSAGDMTERAGHNDDDDDGKPVIIETVDDTWTARLSDGACSKETPSTGK